ncbi:FAD-binding oxidoreductase [Sulfolobus acidocaldarius]|uniref:Alkyldihydroxyacetonephosphate synthase n=4 Tax=Sulfolobus acidocaldarius TaxID=2285 RepID=Q4J7P1_SULAC|nr:FAD-binding oxidoreductase [Sulfolobus acidocaldarius]AAY81190.1 alkyldihydroxyacetonephosphate synthase [Sulfolobus acidocaldarius DSM 639]AGE71808.1 alkyldihydroxyacetonephosphate synthase [Sulfolobus acidocaldarius N8]AGE74079.1 alkyldihydroxyacetonephosphate synthase [Sulfolobus acidocaldarius Ron12/I]ALU29998.1 FAD-linked oxidase [Sulfolobus acidocaldarius]ALU30688.1 FAD-linked oxidase [Sulfolobus acidocaldarius]
MEAETITKTFEKEFGDKKFITNDRVLEEESKAPYLVSPVLSKMGKKVIGVVMADDEEDIFNAVRLCDTHHIPLLARGAGTSTIGQVLPISPSTIVLDINRMREVIESDDSWVRITPSVKVFKALQYLRKRGKELRVYPSSFYISTLGGYIAGGDVGIGSFQYGYHFDNGGINSVRVVGPTGKYELRGEDTLGVAQAAGTTGIISSAELATVDYEDWKDQLVTFNSVEEVTKYLVRVRDYKSKIRRITIEDKETLSSVAKDRLDKVGEWNVIVASTLSLGEEVNMRFLDELAFAAIYVTMSRLTSFKDYFYEVRLLPLESFSRVVKQVKMALGSSVLVHGDVMTLRGETIVYTVFMSDKGNFPVIDSIMTREGIPFEIHSIEVNYRVDEESRLNLMKKLKRTIDPNNILNPGKLLL